MTLATAKWTLEEYHRLIDAGMLNGKRVELIRGEIVVMAPEGKPHAYASTESDKYLTRLLGSGAFTLIVFREPMSGQYALRQDYTSGNISPVAFPDVTVDISTIINE